jgi:hypothetical protein
MCVTTRSGVFHFKMSRRRSRLDDPRCPVPGLNRKSERLRAIDRCRRRASVAQLRGVGRQQIGFGQRLRQREARVFAELH